MVWLPCGLDFGVRATCQCRFILQKASARSPQEQEEHNEAGNFDTEINDKRDMLRDSAKTQRSRRPLQKLQKKST